jgi:hypothetical protein
MSFRDAIAAIEHALGPGSAHMFRSTFGILLERQENLAFGSDGRRHPKPQPGCLKINEPRFEPNYEMRLSDSRTAWATTLLGFVGVESTRLRTVLELYHGDTGARWAGKDRIMAVFPLTKQGQNIVNQARKRYETSADIRDDELIASDIALQEANPNDIRGAQHKAMRREAEDMKEAAWTALARAVERFPRKASKWVD